MIHEFVGHREQYNTIPVSVVDFSFDYSRTPVAARICPPFRPDPSIHQVFCTHTHDSLEILFLRKGAMHVELNQDCIQLKEGELLIINPFDIHGGIIHPEDKYVSYSCLMLELKSYMLDFKGNILDRILSGILEGALRFDAKLDAEHTSTARLINIIDQLQSEYESSMDALTASSECRLMSGVYSLLSELVPLAFEAPSAFVKGHDVLFIRSVNQYICENYASQITIEAICSALGFGERNFYRLFRQNFGTTFISYLREYRIQRALRDYSASNLPITEIAAAVGFTDYCYFSRSFRRMTGVSPSAYFKG